MKQWSGEIEIHANIEQVWELLNGSLESMQKIMPQVIEHKPVKVTENFIGSVHLQKFKEGNRIQEYEVTTLDYLNEPNHKKLQVGFTLANMFEITAFYELTKLDDQHTVFKYTSTNNPLKWFVKLLLVFANEKVVTQFLNRVKNVAEEENRVPVS